MLNKYSYLFDNFSYLDSILESNNIDKVYVAFSGGLDSTILLLACNKYYMNSNIKVFAIHVNHNLQLVSNEWENRCKSFCLGNSIPIIVKRVCVDLGNIESKARESRYRAIADVVKKSIVLFAHHLDDNNELFFMRIQRGSEIDSLYMNYYTYLPSYNLNIYRPFLDISRDRLLSIAKDLSIDYIDDPMNHDIKFNRVYWRKLLSSIKNEQTDFNNGLSISRMIIKQKVSLLNSYLDDDLKTLLVNNDINIININKLQEIHDLNALKANNILHFWVKKYHGLSLNNNQLNSLFSNVIDSHNSKRAYFYCKQHKQEFMFCKSYNYLYCVINNDLRKYIEINVEPYSMHLAVNQKINLPANIASLTYYDDHILLEYNVNIFKYNDIKQSIFILPANQSKPCINKNIELRFANINSKQREKLGKRNVLWFYRNLIPVIVLYNKEYLLIVDLPPV